MSPAWTVDPGLDVLLAQVNDAAPGRSKASDGSVGDLPHQGTVSDHNPEFPAPAGNPAYEVDARDFTHDPAGGADMGVLSEALRASEDPRIKYVIFHKRIFYSYVTARGRAWMWFDYSGSNDHVKHAHVSVRDKPRNANKWSIGIDQGVNDMGINTEPNIAYPALSNGQILAQLYGEIMEGRSPYNGDKAFTAKALSEIKASAAADAARDQAILIAIEALAATGGVDAAPILAAIAALRADVLAAIEAIPAETVSELGDRLASDA